MCMMCNEEVSYRAYLAYVDYIEAEEAAGRTPDIDKAMDVAQAVIDAAGYKHDAQIVQSPSPLSPFYCEPVQKK
jgi:hypothetical protein